MTFSQNNRKSLENSVTRFSYLMMIRFTYFSIRFRFLEKVFNSQFVEQFPFFRTVSDFGKFLKYSICWSVSLFSFFFTHFDSYSIFIKELSICHKLWFSNSLMIFILPNVIWNEVRNIFLNLKSSAKLSCEF